MLLRGAVLKVALGHLFRHDVEGHVLVGQVDRHLDALQLGVQPKPTILVQGQRERFFEDGLVSFGLARSRFLIGGVILRLGPSQKIYACCILVPQLRQARPDGLDQCQRLVDHDVMVRMSHTSDEPAVRHHRQNFLDPIVRQ